MGVVCGRVVKHLEVMDEIRVSPDGEGIYYVNVRDESGDVFEIISNQFMYRDMDVRGLKVGGKFYAVLVFYVGRGRDFGVVHLVKRSDKRGFNSYRRSVGAS